MHQVIETNRLRLKILDESDAEIVLSYYVRNQDFLKPWEPLRQEGFLSLSIQAMSLKLDTMHMARGEMLRYWIFVKDTGELIGTIALSNIIRGVFKSCYMGYKLSVAEIGKGYMTEAVQRVVQLAFEEMQLHRIEANIMPNNRASIHVVTKNGFEQEGISPKYLKINGNWEDHYRFALINENLVE